MLGSSWLRSNRFHFAALIFFSPFSRVKILNVYLNGIVIASLSTASGTRWILTAYRFKICLNHQHKTHFHNVQNLLNQTPTSQNILDICENAKFNMKCWENEAYEHFDASFIHMNMCIMDFRMRWTSFIADEIVVWRSVSDNQWIKSNWISK